MRNIELDERRIIRIPNYTNAEERSRKREHNLFMINLSISVNLFKPHRPLGDYKFMVGFVGPRDVAVFVSSSVSLSGRWANNGRLSDACHTATSSAQLQYRDARLKPFTAGIDFTHLCQAPLSLPATALLLECIVAPAPHSVVELLMTDNVWPGHLLPMISKFVCV